MSWLLIALIVWLTPVVITWLLIWAEWERDRDIISCGFRYGVGIVVFFWPAVPIVIVVYGLTALLGSACRAAGRWLP